MTRIGNAFRESAPNGQEGAHRLSDGGRSSPERTPALVEALERGGADLIELGVPFSDPIADGPVIQRAGERALRAGTTLHRVLEIAREIRSRSEIPLLLFTYLNPVLRYGLESLAKDAAGSGIDGCLLTDASVEEAGEYVRIMRAAGLDTVFLAAPTSSPRRLQLVARVFHRLRLSGFAHGCDRRARFAFGLYRTAGAGDARDYTIAAGGGIRRFRGRSMWPNWAGKWKRWWWAAPSCT